MNGLQVRALGRLMEEAAPPRHLFAADDEVAPMLHVTLEVSHGYDNGNTYEARLWTVEGGYWFPDAFYLRDDGVVYTYDSETDTCHKLRRASWTIPEGQRHRWKLDAEIEPEPLDSFGGTTDPSAGGGRDAVGSGSGSAPEG